jgi:hypothetical protein
MKLMHVRPNGGQRSGNAFPQSECLALCSECICVSTGSGDAPATRRGRRARRRSRRAGRGRDALMDDGCQRVCCFCGGCRALRALVPSFHTGAQGGRRPATCMCAFRPLRARAVFLRVIAHSHTRCVRWPDRTRSCCACECAVVCPRARASARHTHASPTRSSLTCGVRPEWPCLSACLLQSCVRSCRARAACGAMCSDGWCPNRRPPGHTVFAPRGITLQRGWALALAGRVMQSPESHRVNTDPARRRGGAVGTVRTVRAPSPCFHTCHVAISLFASISCVCTCVCMCVCVHVNVSPERKDCRV